MSNNSRQTSLYANRAYSADSVLGEDVAGAVLNATNATYADQLDGVHASGFCRWVSTQHGVANVSSSGLTFVTAGTLLGVYEFFGNGATVTLNNAGSDRRLKKDIAQEHFGLDFVNQLNPVTYRFKSDNTFRHHGVIAQELRDVLPDTVVDSIVAEDSDGTLRVNYVSFIAPLIKAVQELSAEIEILKGN